MAAAEDIVLHDKIRVHSHEYDEYIKRCFVQLAEVWQDLETPAEQQGKQLIATFTAALNTWTDAVAKAKDQQQQVRTSIQQRLAEISETKEALGAEDPAPEVELQRLQGSRSAHRTLRAWQKDVEIKANYWEKCRLQRMADYEDLQARILVLRKLCGLGPMPVSEKPDISRTNMEFLKLELERLSSEKERREDLLRRLLDELHAVCDGIGEDVKEAAAEVHPNLVYIWDEEAARVLRDVYKLSSTYASGSAGGLIDLSDSTISRLSAKLAVMKDLKASRAAHAAELLGVLHSLWDATDIPSEERAHFVKLMSGSLRLHGRSLEKCMAEVRRLEDVRAQQMVDLVNSKGAELRAMCAESHVAEPAGLVEALAAINCEDRNPGAAAELLAKLLHMLAEVQVLTGKRANIIAAIKEVEAAQQEDEWLAAYEVDEQRYKGRDANKKLQRAIKAAKLRDRLPAMLSDVRILLDEWRESEGEPFMYDGKDYQFEVLDVVAAEVEEAAAARAAKAARSASARRQSVIGSSSSSAPLMSPRPASRAPATPGRAGAPPRPASGMMAVSSPGTRRADGPSTPIPLRGVSNKTLQDRHSICVVRTSRDSMMSGPAALSHSGEVRLSRSSSTSSRTATAKPATPSKSAVLSATKKAPHAAAVSPGFVTPTKRKPLAGTAGTPGCSDAASTAAVQSAKAAAGDAASGMRSSTSSKLDKIFSRGSVQHPVAKLPEATTNTPGSAGKGVVGRALRPISSEGGADTAAADQDRGN